MDVIDVVQVCIVEEVGVCVVMVFECVFVDICKDGGVVCMFDLVVIKEIQDVVIIFVMVKVRIGYFVECQIFEVLGVDYIDESEVFILVDYESYVEKIFFSVFFVCGCRNLGEVFCCVVEGVVMICIKGEVGIGDVVEVVCYMKQVNKDIVCVKVVLVEGGVVCICELVCELEVDVVLFFKIVELGCMFVVNFVVGGVVIFVDVVFMMQLGCDGVFVGSGIFKFGDLVKRVKVIVRVMIYYKDVKVLVECSMGFGEVMVGINCDSMKFEEKLVGCGW